MNDCQDKLNCLKNLIRMMCCDGRIEDREKKFLFRAAKELQAEVPDWNALFKEVRRDSQACYPIQNRDRAIASLKAMIVMAKADRQVDPKEGELLLQFAKSLGLSNSQWKQILRDINMQTLFEPFEIASAVCPSVSGSILVLEDDFDGIDPLLDLIKKQGIQFRITGFDEYLKGPEAGEDKVCFHASPEKEVTIQRGQRLLEKSGEKTAAILTRYQGHQVQYLLERGIRTCIIEPVYARDLEKLLARK